MGLFDNVGPVEEQKEDVSTMPLIDLAKKGLEALNAFEKNPNASTCDETERVLNKIVERFNEAPNEAKAKVSGVPSTITMSLPLLRQMLALGPAAASMLPYFTGALKNGINFLIANL